MEHLKYKIYTSENDYQELILENDNFVLQLGLIQNLGQDQVYNYQMSLIISDQMDLNNVSLAEKFIFNLSSIIKTPEDIYKIEIDLNRPNLNVNRKYIFYNEDFHNLDFTYSSTANNSNIFIKFTIDSMDQNYGEDVV